MTASACNENMVTSIWRCIIARARWALMIFFGVFNVSPILAMGEKIGQKNMEVHSIRILECENSTHI